MGARAPASGPVVHKDRGMEGASKFRKLHLTDRVKGKVAADLIQLHENSTENCEDTVYEETYDRI